MCLVPSGETPDTTEQEEELRMLKSKVQSRGLSPNDETVIVYFFERLRDAQQEGMEGMTAYEAEVWPWLAKQYGIVQARRRAKPETPHI